jgi:hypothetical protein
VEGTQATLNELDNELNPTGKPYQTLITDNKGSFELRNVELVSPYAHLIANGFYFNEVTGNKSAAPITLQAIVDVTDKDNINVNVITHLEYYRVLDLVDGGMTVKAAKKQAQKEIFAVFGIGSDSFKDSEDMTIFGTSESDAALLAVSVLLLGDLSEADFTQRLMNFSQAIRNNGAWNNEEAKTAMAVWAVTKGSLIDIKRNISNWNLATEIPAFEKYVNDYGANELKIGVCNDETEWTVKQVSNSNAYPYGHVCVNNFWKRAERLDIYCSESKTCDIFTDPRDGNEYTTDVVGSLNQTWMLEWLHLHLPKSVTDTIGYTKEDALIACPQGWNLPSYDEANAFFDSVCESNYLFTNNVFINTGETYRYDCYNGSSSLYEDRNRYNVVYCVKPLE